MRKKLLTSILIGTAICCSVAKAEKKAAPAKPYISVDFLSRDENEQLSDCTSTVGSTVFIGFPSRPSEFEHYGLPLLVLALRRYTQADLFIVFTEYQVFDYPMNEERFVYNRKRASMFNQLKQKGDVWHEPDVHKVQDGDIHRAAKGKNNTLYDAY